MADLNSGDETLSLRSSSSGVDHERETDIKVLKQRISKIKTMEHLKQVCIFFRSSLTSFYFLF